MTKSLHTTLISKSGKEIPNTAEGSLGLLALGDVGLTIWRKAKTARQADRDILPITHNMNDI